MRVVQHGEELARHRLLVLGVDALVLVMEKAQEFASLGMGIHGELRVSAFDEDAGLVVHDQDRERAVRGDHPGGAASVDEWARENLVRVDLPRQVVVVGTRCFHHVLAAFCSNVEYHGVDETPGEIRDELRRAEMLGDERCLSFVQQLLTFNGHRPRIVRFPRDESLGRACASGLCST